MNDPLIVVLLIALALAFVWRPSEPPGSGITIVMTPPPSTQAEPEPQDGGVFWLVIMLIILALFLL